MADKNVSLTKLYDCPGRLKADLLGAMATGHPRQRVGVAMRQEIACPPDLLARVPACAAFLTIPVPRDLILLSSRFSNLVWIACACSSGDRKT